MIGGEGEANPAWLESGSWNKYAEDEGAAMILLEHRYYGKSHPTEDLGVKNLAWLSSRQALADLAAFTTVMQKAGQGNEAPLTGPWVALGGSYPGSLAAWFRMKYPHLVVGSVSSSAPLIAKADFFEYLEVVDESLEVTIPGCSAMVKEALRDTGILMKRRVGWAKIEKQFKLCSSFNARKSRDVTNLFESLVGNFEGIVQYNKDNRAWEGATWTNITIDTLCEIMIEPNKDPIDRLAKVNDLSLEIEGEECLDHTYHKQVKELQDISWESSAAQGGRQWIYQTCTEFGWYQSSDIPGRPWGEIIPVKFFERMCSDVYGPKFSVALLERGIAETNKEYGGLDISVTNVVFVHGSIDPWHAVGIVKTKTEKSPAILIPGTAHCANMYPERVEDPSELKQARKEVGRLVKLWIEEAKNHTINQLDQ